MSAVSSHELHCQICHKSGQIIGEKRPDGWVRISICGGARRARNDIRAGMFCSRECATVAVLETYGLRQDEVRQWITDITTAVSV
jgi:hypothetical protein